MCKFLTKKLHLVMLDISTLSKTGGVAFHLALADTHMPLIIFVILDCDLTKLYRTMQSLSPVGNTCKSTKERNANKLKNFQPTYIGYNRYLSYIYYSKSQINIIIFLDNVAFCNITRTFGCVRGKLGELYILSIQIQTWAIVEKQVLR